NNYKIIKSILKLNILKTNLTFIITTCRVLFNQFNKQHSYLERWRDWPFDTSATDLLKYCANSRSNKLKIRREYFNGVKNFFLFLYNSFFYFLLLNCIFGSSSY